MKILKVNARRKFIKSIVILCNFFSFIPKKYYCSICGKRSVFFDSWGVKNDIFSRLEIIGGGYRKNVRCPFCNSIDRMRWLDYILQNETDVYINTKNVILHVAPEKCIEEKIKKSRKNKDLYITGDIQEGLADEVIDITNIKYRSKYFDYIIVNHVLEHIEDEERAMTELHRVLKDCGKLIFSMPICEKQNTFEMRRGGGKLTEERRLELYGQKDHVRLYGKDVKERMKKYNFRIEEYKVSDIISSDEIERNRYLEQDRIYIAHKL